MRSLLRSLVVLSLLAAGCAPGTSLLEEEDIVTILHSAVTDYTLIVYLRADGLERHELRRGGVWEMTIEHQGGSRYLLKERGRAPERIEPATVVVLQARIQGLLSGKSPERTWHAVPSEEV
ncbi:MAG: hypothetical protein SH809_10325 [Rhodothermales bacterium]|nr:hypothetical protein [Rhodothermales bacterium]